MSQPSETPSSSSGPAPDAHWLSVVIWLGLLAALLVTSAYAIYATTYGFIASASAGFGSSGPRDTTPTAVASVILSVIAALAIVTTWLRFVSSTSSLIPGQAGGAGESQGGPGLAAWLVPGRQPSDAPGERPGDRRQSPSAGVKDVLISLGATWFVLIITPAILVLLRSTG